MKKGIIAIVLAVLLIGSYVVAQTATRNATEEVFEQFAERVAEDSGYSIELNWLEQGRSSGKLEMHWRLDLFEDEIHYHEVLSLNYGFLRTKIKGEGHLTVFGDMVNDTLFDGHPFISTGVASMGGLTLEYLVPQIEKVIDDGLVLNIPQSVMQIIATDSSLHYTFNNPGFRMAHDVEPGHLDMGALALESHSAWREGTLQHQQVEMTFAGVDVQSPDLSFSISDMRLASHLIIDEGIAAGGLRYEIGSFDMPDVGKGSGVFDLEVHGINYALLESLQQDPELLEDEDYVIDLIYEAFQNNDLKVTLNTLEFEAEGIGRAHLHGDLTVDDIPLTRDEFHAHLKGDPSFVLPYLVVSLHVEELPLIALMSMMMITTEQLPWKFEMREGDLYLNDERIDLEALGL